MAAAETRTTPAPPAPSTPPRLRIGVDVGGTFTDLVAYDGAHLRIVKLSSTPPDFHKAVLAAVRQVTALADAPADVVHGSTVATNALLQRAGEPVAIVTTEGFRDMLLIARQNRPHLYALNVKRPAPVTPEGNWFTVRERISATGEILDLLTDAEIARLISDIQSRNLKHVAVCLLFSFLNPKHEQRIKHACDSAGLTVTLSSDLLPEFREYERASTTTINASLRPPVQAYLTELERGLAEGSRVDRDAPSPPTPGQSAAQRSAAPDSASSMGNRQLAIGNLRIIHSAGGTLSVEQASAQAARLLLSGPAGGVLGAAFVAKHAGFQDLITYDMGGTSTDAATILAGQPQWTTATTVDGLPVGLPMFDIHTIGAGGGSVAHLDTGGALRVGPRSAGAVPGPACYDRGGTEPTVTDANVVLGRILPDQFLGGAMAIRPDLAHAAISRLADAIGKGPTETALGIVRVAEANMTHALRAVTSRRGHNPKRFTLVSFGGAGGLHACGLAESLDIPRVLIPPYAGVLSALGMVVAPQLVDVSQTVVHLHDRLDDTLLRELLSDLAHSSAAHLPDADTATLQPHADVRFRGQSHELKVPFDHASPTLAAIHARFQEAYHRLYNQLPADRPIELVTLRLRRLGHEPTVTLPPLPAQPATSPRTTQLIDSTGHLRTAPVHTRATVPRDTPLPGPALLIDPEATTYIPPGWQATTDPAGSVLLGRRGR